MGQEDQPPGFCFHPTDEELVGYYLKRKVHGLSLVGNVISEADPYQFDPWELPEKSCLKGRGSRLYFFSPIDGKHFKIVRIVRPTGAGYWKTTMKDRTICVPTGVRAVRKMKIFYRGRAPHGEATSWQMHEYMLEHNDSKPFENSYVLCKVFQKNSTNKDERLGALSPRVNTNDGPYTDSATLVKVTNPSPEDSLDSDDVQTFLTSNICDPNKPDPNIQENGLMTQSACANQVSAFPVEMKLEKGTEGDIGNMNIQGTTTTEEKNLGCCSFMPDQHHMLSHIEEGDFIELNDLITPLEFDLCSSEVYQLGSSRTS